jgi:hypothetical protein
MSSTLDTQEQTAVDKWSGVDLINPPLPKFQAQSIPQETPPPTLKKSRTQKPPILRNSGAPSLAGYLLPSPMMAAVQDHIEGLAFQKVLEEADQKMKLRFADHFPLRLLDNTTEVPGHMFHCIR